MTLLQLQVFIVVCQEKNFTRAGEVLKMTQSAVSQAIGNLENELSVRLLNRDRHGVAVTHIGERVLFHTREIMQHTHEMQQEATAAAGTESGKLRIAAASTVSASYLPELLASFQSSHPSVQMTMIEGKDEEVNSLLVNHLVDVSFSVLPVEGVDVVSSIHDRFLLFMPTEHRLSHHNSVSLKEIQDEPYIQLKADSSYLIKDSFKQQGLTCMARYEVGEICTILSMIEKGIGVSILPEMSVCVHMPDIASIELEPPITRTIHLAVHDINRISPICADFILHAKEQLAKSLK